MCLIALTFGLALAFVGICAVLNGGDRDDDGGIR